MTESVDIPALACPDCPAGVHASNGTSPVTGEQVLVVRVEHELTCPWLARHAPHGANLAMEGGILQHTWHAA